jgi:hypothetical protein
VLKVFKELLVQQAHKVQQALQEQLVLLVQQDQQARQVLQAQPLQLLVKQVLPVQQDPLELQ